MIVTWYGVDGATYDVERTDDNGVTWDTVVEDAASTTYTDTAGTSLMFYRVRVHGSSIWNPRFAALPDTSATSCTLFGYIRDASGALFSGANVYIKVPSERQFLTDAFYVTEEPVSEITSSGGYWSISLPRGLSVNIRIPIAKINETVTIPNQASADLASLL
jgi:hypothetical protein